MQACHTDGTVGGGRVPSSSTITVSQTCLCRKFTVIVVLVVACPLHPSSGNSHDLAAVGKDIQYILVSMSRRGYTTDFYLLISHHTWYSDAPPATPPPCYCHIPDTVILPSVLPIVLVPPPSSAAASDWVPADRQGWQIIPTIFLTFFRNTTLSNNPVMVSNAPCIQTGSVDVTRPSST